MNLSVKPKDRRVVPNWRYYDNTLAAGELNNWRLHEAVADTYSIEDYAELWRSHRSLYRAGDLLSAAITNGSEDDKDVREAAQFILDESQTPTQSLVQSALYVLGEERGISSQSKAEINRLRECTAVNDIHLFIHGIRHRLHSMPYNPFLYVDLARAYLLLGQTAKAENAMQQALHFGADNRFVARSAARFYLHQQDIDRAYEIIRAKGAVSTDPWLMAAEISINMLRGKSSNYIKKGREIIESGHCSPFGFTELASSIGTLELYNGSNRKSNKLFKKALISPNDNSLAQIQWVNSFDALSFDISKPVVNDFEVRTMDAWSQGKYNDAVHEAVSWICDMPFAHKPINIGYMLCANFTHDFALAAAILDVGLRSDDNNPQLLNNKAYCAARDNQIKEAKEALEKLKNVLRNDDTLSLRVCSPATEGLILYREGNHVEGSMKYEEAITIAKSEDTEEGKFLYRKAVLNYCRERLLAGDGDAADIMAEVNHVEFFKKEVELLLLKEEIDNDYNSKKNERGESRK